MSADRNLLFGVLALQMDFVDQGALIRGMHAWVLEKHKPLGQLLVEQGGLAAEHRALLEPLVEAHVRAHGGDAQRSLAALSSVRSVREALGRVADADVQASLGHLATPTGPGVTVDLPAARSPEEPAGRFRVLRPHARGGLGEVSVALDSELRRQVALKEIRPEHADNPTARARFLLEAEVTGQLEHPGVVPVYGLGSYPDGRPFYAMRFVEGDSLHDAIRRFHEGDQPDGTRTLAFRQLLARFVDVCNAVAYAHSKGVLHRDLKPGNVLLGPYGETLVVDWGLAKQHRTAEGAESAEEEAGIFPLSFSAPSAPSAVSSPDTLPGQVVGTPGYMAPEQAAGELERLGPATDVYSLGATLYHLLTGRPPVEGTEPAEMLARVRKGDFPRPRQILSTVPPALEAVCRKAMALRPEERYVSPKELAEELERWLADEPVRAYPEPLAARVRRQARRHPAALAAVAAVLLAGLVGLGLGLAAVRAEQQRTASERDRAEENATLAQEAGHKAQKQANRAAALNKFLLEDLLAEAAPEKNPRQKQVTVEEVLNKAAAKVDKAFADQPNVEADVRLAVGATYRKLGLFDRARPQLEKTVALHRKSLGPDHSDTLKATNELGMLLLDQGKPAEAEPLLRQNLETRRRLLGPEHAETLTTLNNLALLLYDEGKAAEAEPLFRQSLEIRLRVLGPDHSETLAAVNNLALDLRDLGKLAEAETLFRQNLQTGRRVEGPDHPHTLTTADNLALLLSDVGKRAEAETLFRQNLETRRRVLGPEHPDTLTTVNNLGYLLIAQRNLAEAETLFRQNLQAERRVKGPNHPHTLGTLSNLASVLRASGKLAEALPLDQETLEARRRVLGPDHPDTLTALSNLARLLQDQGKRAEAEPLLRQSLEARRRVLGPDHPDTLASMINLARLLTEQGQRDEAERLAREALARGRKVLPPGHRAVANGLTVLGEVLTASGRAPEAEALLRECLESYRKTQPPGEPRTAQAESLLGACLLTQKKYAEAEPLLLAGCRVLENDPGTPGRARALARQRLVELYEAWGKPSEADRWKREPDQEAPPTIPKEP
jgi:tetratricopeptide (TPR) repeat protein/tRNA A-37 threonylcarbamoyl transferase component Bud32